MNSISNMLPISDQQQGQITKVITSFFQMDNSTNNFCMPIRNKFDTVLRYLPKGKIYSNTQHKNLKPYEYYKYKFTIKIGTGKKKQELYIIKVRTRLYLAMTIKKCNEPNARWTNKISKGLSDAIRDKITSTGSKLTDGEGSVDIQYKNDKYYVDIYSLRIENESTDKASYTTLTKFLKSIKAEIKSDIGISREAFNKRMKELIESFYPTGGKVKIVSGFKLDQVYIESKSPITSCMTGKSHKDYIKLYGLNPDIIMIAVLYEGSKKIARCLIWKVKEKNKKYWIVDRIFPNNTKSQNQLSFRLVEKAVKEKIEIKFLREYGYVTKDKSTYSFMLNLPPNRMVPYLDTFNYGRLLDNGMILISNRSSITKSPEGTKFITKSYLLESTSGSPFTLHTYKCKECFITYYSPLWGEDRRGNKTYDNTDPLIWEAINFIHCITCFKKLFVKAINGGSGEWVKKSECQFSNNLKEWVRPTNPWVKINLEQVDGDWKRRKTPVKKPTKEGSTLRDAFIKHMENSYHPNEIQGSWTTNSLVDPPVWTEVPPPNPY